MLEFALATFALLPMVLTVVFAYPSWNSLARPWMYTGLSAVILYSGAIYLAMRALSRIGMAGVDPVAAAELGPVFDVVTVSLWRSMAIWSLAGVCIMLFLRRFFRK